MSKARRKMREMLCCHLVQNDLQGAHPSVVSLVKFALCSVLFTAAIVERLNTIKRSAWSRWHNRMRSR